MQLTAMIFASDPEAQARIERRCTTSGDIKVIRGPEYRPKPPDMIRLLNSCSPEIAFIEFADRDNALRTEEALHAACPNLVVLGFSDHWQYDSLLKTSHGYLRIISSNLSLEEFRKAISDVVTTSRVAGPDNIIVFLPAKAGTGASTLALNVTAALANKCGKSAILIEADLHSGPAGMFLNLNPTYSIADALNESHSLDARWNDLVTPVNNFTILPSWNIRGPIPQPSPWAYRRLLSYARNRYEYVIIDLPEVVNPATEIIVTSAKAVYLVCTPEVPSLLLARKRCAGLRDRGVPQDRLRIVLNRYYKEGAEPEAVAEILGLPIARVIPNDYKTLWEANLKRRLVDEKSIVGAAIESFAWSLTGLEVPVAQKAARKMFGLFPAA